MVDTGFDAVLDTSNLWSEILCGDFVSGDFSISPVEIISPDDITYEAGAETVDTKVSAANILPCSRDRMEKMRIQARAYRKRMKERWNNMEASLQSLRGNCQSLRSVITTLNFRIAELQAQVEAFKNLGRGVNPHKFVNTMSSIYVCGGARDQSDSGTVNETVGGRGKVAPFCVGGVTRMTRQKHLSSVDSKERKCLSARLYRNKRKNLWKEMEAQMEESRTQLLVLQRAKITREETMFGLYREIAKFNPLINIKRG
jgi:hypothetical protein